VLLAALATLSTTAPAAAAPPPPRATCSFVVCDMPSDPAQLAAGGLGFGSGVTVIIGDSLTGGCRLLSGPVAARDVSGPPPAGFRGHWAYQVCGDPATVARAARRGTASRVRAWCAGGHRACSVVVYWKLDHPDPRVPVPVGEGPSGIPQYFTLAPDAASSPLDGQVITNFPTWFYDANHLDFTGVPIPASPVGGFGGAATAIHLRSWWHVDGRQICNARGRTPARSQTRAEAARPSPDCGMTFTQAGAHRAVAHATWLIAVQLAFPPYVIVFPLTLSDGINVNAREVQADTQ
jgi:hypothetical protein